MKSKTDNEDPLTITKIDEQGYWSGDLFICNSEDSAKWELVGKHINKLEPKFKVGNWIVFNGWVLHIDEIVDGYYRTTTIGGIPNSYDWNIDNIARLWTIQDAKPGDVLVDRFSKDNIIILYEGINPKLSILAYCGWNGYNLSIKTNGLGYGNLDNTNYSPTTKEQRDLLFQKVKEAGYEWNAEKKELKKIEQEELSVFENSLKHIIEEAIEEGDTHNLKADAELLLNLMQKPSDEDMKEALRTEYEKGRADAIAEMQKQWKPTKEQMDALLFVVQHYTPKVTDKVGWDSIKILELMYYEIKR